jgi:flagellin
MISLTTNVVSLDAQTNLNNTQNMLDHSLQQLSSGYRINTAADDAAGLAISTQLESQVNGLNQASQNANDGINMIQTAEGALQTTTSMLQRMRELAVEASNSTLSSSDLGSINTELQQLSTQVNAISTQTQFNGQTLLSGALTTSQSATSTANVGNILSTTGGNASISAVNVSSATAGTTYTFSSASAGTLTLTNGTTNVAQTLSTSAIGANGSATLDFSQLGASISLSSDSGGKTAAGLATDLAGKTVVTASGSGAANFQVGANATDTMGVSFSEVDISANGMSALNTALTNFNTTQSVSNAQALITAVDTGISQVDTVNASLGASQNRLQDIVSNLATSSQNLSAADSTIKDTDVAAQTAQMTQENILMQSGISVLAQANQMPQMVLKLLGG